MPGAKESTTQSIPGIAGGWAARACLRTETAVRQALIEAMEGAADPRAPTSARRTGRSGGGGHWRKHPFQLAAIHPTLAEISRDVIRPRSQEELRDVRVDTGNRTRINVRVDRERAAAFVSVPAGFAIRRLALRGAPCASSSAAIRKSRKGALCSAEDKGRGHRGLMVRATDGRTAFAAMVDVDVDRGFAKPGNNRATPRPVRLISTKR